MHPIYYVFLKETGAFMGSGTVHFNDALYGCTEVACIHDPLAQHAHWDGETWIVTDG